MKTCEKCGHQNMYPFKVVKKTPVCAKCGVSLPTSGTIRSMIGHYLDIDVPGGYEIGILKLND